MSIQDLDDAVLSSMMLDSRHGSGNRSTSPVSGQSGRGGGFSEDRQRHNRDASGRSMSRTSEDSLVPSSRSNSRPQDGNRGSGSVSRQSRSGSTSGDSQSCDSRRSDRRNDVNRSNKRRRPQEDCNDGDNPFQPRRRNQDSHSNYYNKVGSRSEGSRGSYSSRSCPDNCNCDDCCGHGRSSEDSLIGDQSSGGYSDEDDYYSVDEDDKSRCSTDELWKQMRSHGQDMIANAAKLKQQSKRCEETTHNLRHLEQDYDTLLDCIDVVIGDGWSDTDPQDNDSPVRLLNRVHTLHWTTVRAEKQLKADLTDASEAARQAERALEEVKKQLENEKRVSQMNLVRLSEEKRRRETAEDSVVCVVCMDKRRKKMLIPCKHLLLCDECSVDSCPICRMPVQKTQDVFLS